MFVHDDKSYLSKKINKIKKSNLGRKGRNFTQWISSNNFWKQYSEEFGFSRCDNFEQSLFVQSLFVQFLFIQSLFVQSLLVQSLFVKSLFVQSLFNQSLFNQSLFVQFLAWSCTLCDKTFHINILYRVTLYTIGCMV